jgi:hypothetical protein
MGTLTSDIVPMASGTSPLNGEASIGWISYGDDFDKKPITFHPRCNPPLGALLQTVQFSVLPELVC